MLQNSIICRDHSSKRRRIDVDGAHCWLILAILGTVLAGLPSGVPRAAGQDNSDPPPKSSQNPKEDPAENVAPENAKTETDANEPDLTNGFLVSVPLPIDDASAKRVISSVDRILENIGGGNTAGRPILILEFDNRNGTNGVGSDFEDSLKIARYLTSAKVQSLRTIAYLPGNPAAVRELFADGEKPQSTFQGHAVLVALSCDEIVMHKDAAIGNAGVDVEAMDGLLLNAYETMTAKRKPVPVPVALAMLDKDRTVIRVERSDDSVAYVNEEEFAKLEADGKTIDSTTISDVNNMAFFTSEDMQTYRLIRHRVDSRRELADRFNLPATALEGDPSLGEKWVSVHVKVTGAITKRMASWIDNALSTRVNAEDTNLIIVEIDSPGGDPSAAVQLANRFAEFNPQKVRTVAFVPNRARGASSIVAFGCDHLVMGEEAVIGGEGRPEIKPEQLDALKETIAEIANKKGKTWSLNYGMLDPSFEVRRMKNSRTGRIRLLSEEELQSMKDMQLWQELELVDLGSGLEGSVGERLSVVRSLAADFEQLKAFYQITDDPTELEPTLADKWVQRFAHQLASPRVAWLVLFAAIFLLSTELSNPGLGVPGFLSAVCWMLFFWSQYFDGNASVLEILLFVAGAICVLIEFFVLPGFGIFGIGGGLMMTVSIILAVQTFVIPQSPEEMNKLTTSLFTFLGACSGFFVALFVFRRYMTRIPMLRKLALDPGTDVDSETLKMKEQLVDYETLVGRKGITQTKLMPSGKAVIGQEIYNVISDGRMIEKGEEIVVKNVSGNKIEVGLKSS